MKLLIVICGRSKTSKILNLLNENNINYHITFYGNGTANNEMLSYLGLVDTEKEIIMSLLKKEDVEDIILKLESAESFKNHGAVAFAIPLDSINKSTLNFIEQ